jgi:hypothetical protein
MIPTEWVNPVGILILWGVQLTDIRRKQMKPDQKFTPKYWAGHNKSSDDVFVTTLHKCKSDALLEMDELFGEDWYMDEDFEVIIVEIKQVILCI